MEIDGEAEAAMNRWLGRDTFHTGHSNDDELFYRFVNDLWNCNQSLIDEAGLREAIKSRIAELHEGDFDDNYINPKIANWARTAQTIMEYHMAVEDYEVDLGEDDE